ncbi:MAG: 2-hydroxyglutaryl-CoA dehydratase, partial [Clostridia bacterium]|nr:2-hydroxyglutaryl-CoA dehydratase [Clostridia bacterium]
MLLTNQIKPYENEKGTAMKLAEEWTEKLGKELSAGRINYKHVKENYRAILADFAKIPRTMR